MQCTSETAGAHGNAERVFKTHHSAAERRAVAERMLAKYPTHVPVVLGPHGSSDPPCKRCKILVRRSDTLAQLMHQVRRQLCMTREQNAEAFMMENSITGQPRSLLGMMGLERNPAEALEHTALFLFVKDRVLPMSKRIEEVYEQFKDEDLILYVHYSKENTFG